MSELSIGVRDLKARLSEYLRQVKQGNTVIITDHGHPVGRLVPVEQPLEERLKVLRDAGMVAWNGKKLRATTPKVINKSDKLISDIVTEMRD